MNNLKDKKHRLLIMRHAEAAQSSDSDRARPLTSKEKMMRFWSHSALSLIKLLPIMFFAHRRGGRGKPMTRCSRCCPKPL